MVLANLDDIRRRAARRLPKVFFEYIDGAAFSETTARRNVEDFQKIDLRQRVLRDVSRRDLGATILGTERPLPIVLGPVGFTGLFDHKGEIKAARAAHGMGLPYCLSSFAIASLPELRAATTGPLWFQLYVLKNRDLASDLIRRAREAEAEALVLTVDTPMGGVREKDIRNGFRSQTRITPRIALALARRPGWCLRILQRGMPQIGNLAGHPEYGRHALEQATRLADYIDAAMTWEDVDRIRDQWQGKLVIKGITEEEDAVEAARHGADAIVVSNHGGRQLDSARSTIDALPGIVAAVNGRCEVLFDSGIRRGSDILKAMALGAQGVLLGRSYAYGLAADGQRGVETVLTQMRAELETQMAQTGVTELRGVAAHAEAILRRRAE